MSYIGRNNVTKDSNNGAAIIPSGTTAQRPLNPLNGMVRFNTDIGNYENYMNGSWRIGNGAQGGGSNNIFFENDLVVTDDYTVGDGKNAGTFGPISINSNVVVTIPDNSTWTII